MLTAQTKLGKEICLANPTNKENLQLLRRTEEFYCPICGEGVTLKLGEQRIFHFAHQRGGSCREFYENETIYHMQGKQQLYQWLLNQKIPAILEYYDRDIQQRPDIMFQINGKKYALEYQCSTIPEEVFLRRTQTYLENDYIPIWIIADNHINLNRKRIISLSNFHYLFLRLTTSGNCYLPSYCPENHRFHLIEILTSYTIKNASTHHLFYSPDELKISGLLEPQMKKAVCGSGWKIEIEKFIHNITRFPNPANKRFLNELYTHHLNPFLLPPEIGLPVPLSPLIQTPPIIWQTYIFIDLLTNKTPCDYISFQEMKYHFNNRVRRGEVVPRKLPQFDHLNPFEALIQYFDCLTKVGVLERKGDTRFQLINRVDIPTSNRERTEALSRFNQNYGRTF